MAKSISKGERMFKNIVLLVASLILVGACSSGEDVIQKALNDIPPPVVTPDNQDGFLSPQSVESDVPELIDGATYYGKQFMTIGEDMSFVMMEDNNVKVIDLELQTQEAMTIAMTQFGYGTAGSCSDFTQDAYLLEMYASGDVASIEQMTVDSEHYLFPNTRYVIRVGYDGVAGCDSVTAILKFEEQN